MFPTGRGNDSLDAGDIYLISVFGTNEMLAAVGKELCLREYQEGHHDQMWICEVTSDHRISMRNRHTEDFLGWWEGDKLGCGSQANEPWGWLTFTRLSLGGYPLKVHSDHNYKLRPVQRVDGDSPHLKAGEMVPNRLARSSAPFYDGEDADESINEISIEFLNKYGIKNIISLNSVELSPRQKGRLHKAKISYSHIKATVCTAVTQEQFDQIWNAYDKAGVTIVYCGYGDGRTGMAISAIQLFQGRALDENDYRGNGVQCSTQIAALNALSDRIKGVDGHSGPVDTLDTQPPPYAAPENTVPEEKKK
ncbi:hypothetical protein B9Z19DRAFT_1130581 [Tuber borchii]|uniref:Tyrosine specific protein phosphatases domain-containing protein n=1 Tax=Tuber borchii TaxID=42251 RepID=A0A2T6ZK61_TUBBO|nr:hypothetical protein B9Z19DRAFT_1130581 [Tuber borchii]